MLGNYLRANSSTFLPFMNANIMEMSNVVQRYQQGQRCELFRNKFLLMEFVSKVPIATSRETCNLLLNGK